MPGRAGGRPEAGRPAWPDGRYCGAGSLNPGAGLFLVQVRTPLLQAVIRGMMVFLTKTACCLPPPLLTPPTPLVLEKQ